LYKGLELGLRQLRLKISVNFEGRRQALFVVGPVDFRGAELAQMVRDELAVEKHEPAFV
jgi:hypothetical protein